MTIVDNNIEVQDEVPDYLLVPCDVYVCEIDGTPYPEYIVGQQSVRRSTPESLTWEHVTSLVANWAELYDENNYRWVRVHDASSDCDYSCDWCSEPMFRRFIYPHSLRVMQRHGEMICHSCRDDSYTCDSCSRYVYTDNAYHLNDGNSTYCESCWDDLPSCEYCDTRYSDEPDCGCRSGIVLSYGEKFHPLIFHTVDSANQLVRLRERDIPERQRNGIFMGLEFEMENMLDIRSTGEISELFRDAYDDNRLMLKHDGSISDGFELVTQPHTLDAFMHTFPWDLVREAQSEGMRGWDVGHREIGIHIHVNRKAFYTKPEHTRRNASPHLMGFMYFIYKNVAPIKRIAGRNVQYGHMSEVYLEEAYRICRFGDSQYRRTLGINLQNDSTVELRMFRSTMRVERVQAYLQFVEAAVRYTQTDRVTKMRDRFNFRNFATWCSFQERYAQLNSLIQEVNAIEYARPLSNDADAISSDWSDEEEFVPCQSDNNN